MLDADVQRISNLYNVAVRATQEEKDLDIPIAPFGHARLIYRVRDAKISLVLLRTKQDPLTIDNEECLTLLQCGNLQNKTRVETLQLAYNLVNNN